MTGFKGNRRQIDATNTFKGTVPVTNGTTTVAMTATDGSQREHAIYMRST